MKTFQKLPAIEIFRSKAAQLLSFVECELGTFDTLSVTSNGAKKNSSLTTAGDTNVARDENMDSASCVQPNAAFLFSLISKLKALDVSGVSTFLRSHEDTFMEILRDPRVKNEANVIEGRVFTKRGAPKKPQDDRLERRRRQSFAATAYADGEIILSTEGIKSMSDLNFLFSLNAFFLPYCDSSKQRTMYEHFFDVFLKLVHEKQPATPSFRLLQESIMIIQKISEAWMNSIEVLLEMLSIGFTRIKTHEAMMTPSLKSSFNSETQDGTARRLSEVLKVITSQDKVYRMIGTGSLTDANSKRTKIPTLIIKPENYLDKFCNQMEILEFARETDTIVIDVSVTIISEFVTEFPEFVNSLRLYIETFRIFTETLIDKTGVFQTFASSFINMCKILDVHESNLNVTLESPKRSPKGNKWFSPRKSLSSPK
jgi:hypothetical protein